MLWLAATFLTLLVLAWRGTRLAHATGVLGVLLLFYGWLGSSGAVFLAALLLYLVVAVPLNAVSLRQEWLSRPLLDHLLRNPALAPVAAPAGAGLDAAVALPPHPAQVLLADPMSTARDADLDAATARGVDDDPDGDWSFTGRIAHGWAPPRESPPASEAATGEGSAERPPSPLERDALAAALGARLAVPLRAALPHARTIGRLAAELYAAAGLRALPWAWQPVPTVASIKTAAASKIGDDDHSGDPASLGGRLAAARAWRLARAQAALGRGVPPALAQVSPPGAGSSPHEAAGDGAAPVPTADAALLLALHPGWQALRTALADDHPHRRLLAFDLALGRWLRHAAMHAVRALLAAASGGWLLPATVLPTLAAGIAAASGARKGPSTDLDRSAPTEPVLEEHAPLQRQAQTAEARLRALAEGWLALGIAADDRPHGRALLANVASPLAAALLAQAELHALLAHAAGARAPHLELPLLRAAVAAARWRAETAQRQAIAALPWPVLSGLLRLVLFPLGYGALPPGDAALADAARALLLHPEVRLRLAGAVLLDGEAARADATAADDRTGAAANPIESTPTLAELHARCTDLARLQGPLGRLAQAGSATTAAGAAPTAAEPHQPQADPAVQLAEAHRRGYLSDAEHGVLADALAFAARQA